MVQINMQSITAIFLLLIIEESMIKINMILPIEGFKLRNNNVIIIIVDFIISILVLIFIILSVKW